MRASLFITCYNDTLFPETGRAVVRLLERLGVELDFLPAQTCCGQMHANTGFRAEAYSQAKRFVQLYRDAECVVIPSSSCVAMIRDQYAGLFEELGNEELRKQFGALLPRVFELSEFLTDKLGVEDVGAYFPHRVTYHASCHGLRGLHVGDRPFRLAEQGARSRTGSAGEPRTLLRIRRNIFREERRGLHGHAGCQAHRRACNGRRVLHRTRQQLPDAPGRGAASAEEDLQTIHMAGILASTAEDPHRATA